MKAQISKLRIATTMFALVAAPTIAAAQMSGVSRPDPAPITDTPEDAPVKAKPTAGIPMTTTPSTSTTAPVVYGPYVPYRAPGTAATTPAAFDPDANVVTSVGAMDSKPLDRHEWANGVVTSVPERDGEIREGTLVKARVTKELSTERTTPGTIFQAELTEPVKKGGLIILPVGAVLEGRVTEVRSGKRISGRAMMHLEPRSVTLPDGTQYILHAQLIDTSDEKHMKMGSEGDLVRRDHPKETLAIVGGVTGVGAVAGAVAGGGVGAIIGAGIGATAGTIVWLKQDRQATLPQDSVLVFSLTVPMELKPLHVGPMPGQ